MSINNYTKIKTKEKDEMFIELFELKRQKKILDDKIKAIEKVYKKDTDSLTNDVFFELSNGIRFSIKVSKRKGAIDTKRLEAIGLDVDEFRKPDTTIRTLRIENES